MSKSLGTGIDPLVLIDGGPRPPVFTEGGDFPAYGADAVRYGLLAMSSTQDVRFNEGTIAEGRQLANKLFNASRLVLLRVPEGVTVPAQAPAPATVEDTWILSRLQAAEAEFADAIARVRVPPREPRAVPLHLRRAVRLVPRDAQAAPVRGGQRRRPPRSPCTCWPRRSTLAHPVIPFVTEEIWSLMPGAGDLLMGHRWPEADEALRDLEVEAEVARAIEATQALRTWRDGVARRPGRARAGAAGRARLRARARARRAAGALRVLANGDEPVATVGVPGGVVAVMPSDAVDMEAERERAAERAERLQGRDRARRGQARQPGLRRQGARGRSSRPSATSSTSCRRSSKSFHDAWDLGPRRGAPALARAVRHALRPGAHAPAAHRARLAAGALPRRARRRDQRQVLDRALHRGAAGGARRAHRAPTSRRT